MVENGIKGGLPEGAATEFGYDMSYGDYLGLERHDEMLFVVVHQATELWLKLVLHEMAAAMAHIQSGDLPPAFKMLARVSRIQAQLIQSWAVLSTLTPADYMTFRAGLGSASGFEGHDGVEIYVYPNADHAFYNHQEIDWMLLDIAPIGKLDPTDFPVAGVETADKVKDKTKPPNTLMARWAESAPK